MMLIPLECSTIIRQKRAPPTHVAADSLIETERDQFHNAVSHRPAARGRAIVATSMPAGPMPGRAETFAGFLQRKPLRLV
jgi:hypothetical protein